MQSCYWISIHNLLDMEIMLCTFLKFTLLENELSVSLSSAAFISYDTVLGISGCKIGWILEAFLTSGIT
jgi:hypothetical protein